MRQQRRSEFLRSSGPTTFPATTTRGSSSTALHRPSGLDRSSPGRFDGFWDARSVRILHLPVGCSCDGLLYINQKTWFDETSAIEVNQMPISSDGTFYCYWLRACVTSRTQSVDSLSGALFQSTPVKLCATSEIDRIKAFADVSNAGDRSMGLTRLLLALLQQELTAGSATGCTGFHAAYGRLHVCKSYPGFHGRTHHSSVAQPRVRFGISYAADGS